MLPLKYQCECPFSRRSHRNIALPSLSRKTIAHDTQAHAYPRRVPATAYQPSFIISPRGTDITMDFGGRQKPLSRLFSGVNEARANNDENDPATATPTTKRQRSTEDYQGQLLQQTPPQTRRMIGMGLGLGFPGSSSSGSGASNRSASDSAFLSPSNEEGLAACVSPPKLTIGRGASISSSISSSMSFSSKGSGSTISSALAADSEEIESASPDDRGGFSGVPTESKIASNSKSPDAVFVGGGGSRRSCSSVGRTYAAVEKDHDVDEHELGHRLSYLQMRGYDQRLLDVMDEGILEESSEEYSSASEGLGHHPDQVESQQEYYHYAGVEISFDLREQPAVVTPERQ